MSSDRISVDSASLREAGKALETKGVELQVLHERWYTLIAEARSALGQDKNGRAMAEKLTENSDETGTALKNFARAVRNGGQAFQGAADAFVATEEANTDAAASLTEATSSTSSSSVDGVSTGSTSTGTGSTSSSGTSTSTGRH